MEFRRFKDLYKNAVEEFSQLGLRARRCPGEEGVRVKPVQIDGNVSTSPFSVTLFVDGGDILGVGVSDMDTLELVANVGETWEDGYLDEDDFVQKYDALSGERMLSSGWTLTRRLDGQEHNFRSLTGLSEALSTGLLGVVITNYELWDDVRDDDLDCDGQCEGCECAGEEAEEFAEIRDYDEAFGYGRTEPSGWVAPEFRPKGYLG